jgi:hypothetical protein
MSLSALDWNFEFCAGAIGAKKYGVPFSLRICTNDLVVVVSFHPFVPSLIFNGDCVPTVVASLEMIHSSFLLIKEKAELEFIGHHRRLQQSHRATSRATRRRSSNSSSMSLDCAITCTCNDRDPSFLYFGKVRTACNQVYILVDT